MEFIQPQQIAAQIMTLMDEADEFVILVSPYNKITEWPKLLNALNRLRQRNIPLTWYSRKGEMRSLEEVQSIGIDPIQIANLHAKVYLNEKQAIITSMNLTRSSDDNSIDCGYKTETRKEYDEISAFVERYIKGRTESALDKVGHDIFEYCFNAFCDHFYGYIHTSDHRDFLRYHIADRTIDLSLVDHLGGIAVYVVSILPGEVYDILNSNRLRLGKGVNIEVELVRTGKGHYDLLRFVIPMKELSEEQFSETECKKCVSLIFGVFDSVYKILQKSTNKYYRDYYEPRK